MEVRNNEERSRYELVIDNNVAGIADYHAVGDVLVFPHTEIDPERRGQGLGDKLIRGALDEVRRRNAKVRAQCWFVRDFLRDNPDYADLKAS